jgi:DNA-3-methyladenine glycosylase I
MVSARALANIKRCPWAQGEPLYQRYHDEEWGVPRHDDLALYENLTLDGFQAGLAWITILRKREAFRRAFDGFDPARVSRFGQRDVQRLLRDPGIVRHRGKIEAAITNARATLRIQEEEGGFAPFLWNFVGGKTKRNRFRTLSQIPAQTKESLAMSKALRERGFAFVGPTICYAFMQAVGMVNDHLVSCFRW